MTCTFPLKQRMSDNHYFNDLQVQSELGDYDPIEHGPSVDYLRDFDFAPSQSDDILEKIMEIHRTTLKGQAPAEAGSLYA
jgi:hypothetical protein